MQNVDGRTDRQPHKSQVTVGPAGHSAFALLIKSAIHFGAFSCAYKQNSFLSNRYYNLLHKALDRQSQGALTCEQNTTCNYPTTCIAPFLCN